MFHKVFEYFYNTKSPVYLFEVCSVVGVWVFVFFFFFPFEFRVRMLHVTGKLLLRTVTNGSEILWTRKFKILPVNYAVVHLLLFLD